MIFDGIILKCTTSIKAERSGSAMFHILNGKKSIQTVQDIHMYNLKSFYGVFKSLNKYTFDRKIKELINNSLLMELNIQDSVFQITKNGERWLDKNEISLPFNYYNGLKYCETASIYFDRLTLLIQTLTNSKMDYFSFIPVIDKSSVETWVKVLYRKLKPNESRLLPTLYEELSKLLQYFSKQEAEMFVDRLTGYKNYGMSINQLADTYEMTNEDIQLLFTGMIHRIMDVVQNDKSDFPLMSFIIKDLGSTSFISNSAKSTYQLLKKGYSINTIAQIRNLKNNTIYDHIVEIALYDTNFPIDYYVTKEKQQDIINAFNITKSYKLKKIKQLVDEDISYFQIRLVLAVAKNLLKTGD